ncbi:MAG: phosphoesterase, partial [Planctomycetota bacterium]
MTRELREEIHVDGDLGIRFLGLINDDSNAVGMVHLGLAYLVDVAAEPMVADLALADPRMESLGQLRANGDWHETWSRLLLDDPKALVD